MATRTSAKPKSGGGELAVKKIRAENVGPISEFEDNVALGVNEVQAGNGQGKSNFIDWIAASSGAPIPLSVLDGENAGRLIIDGSVVLEYQRKKGKQPHVSLASVSSVALVVDPGIKDPASAEEARLKNLLKMVEAETTEEMIEFFLTHEAKSDEDEPRLDTEAYDYVDLHYGVDKLRELDPVAAADVLIKGTGGLIHKLKREYRDEAANAQARYQVAHPEKPEKLSDVSLLDADAEYRNAVGDHRQVQGEASQRAQLERQRAEIEQTLGDRPDVFAADALVEGAQEGYDEVAAEIMELEKRLSAARQKAISAKVTLDQFKKDATEARRAAESWDRRQAILETPITGATAADVLKAANRVDLAKSALDLARETTEYRKKLEVAQAAREERDRATARESEIEKLADGVPARLGAQFNSLGIPDARVNNGVLEVKNEKGKWEPFHRRSKGQQWRWALPIYVKHNPGAMVALLKEAWNELDLESKGEIHKAFVEAAVIGVVEVTTKRGEDLHIERFVA